MLPLHPLVLAATLFAALFATTVFSADDLCVLFVTSHDVISKRKRPSRFRLSRSQTLVACAKLSLQAIRCFS